MKISLSTASGMTHTLSSVPHLASPAWYKSCRIIMAHTIGRERERERDREKEKERNFTLASCLALLTSTGPSGSLAPYKTQHIHKENNTMTKKNLKENGAWPAE